MPQTYTLAIDLVKPMTTTTALVSPSGPRVYALLINEGATVIRLGMGKAAVSGRGPRLAASGGWFEINGTNPFHGEIHAIAESGTPSLSLTEW